MKQGERLLRLAQRWDEAALCETYDTYAPAIHRYIYRKTGDADTAQDLTAETFQRFLEALKRGAGPTEHLSGWLYRVAHNLIVDHYRRQPEIPDAPVGFRAGHGRWRLPRHRNDGRGGHEPVGSAGA